MQAWHWRCLKWSCLGISIASVILASIFMWHHNSTEALPESTVATQNSSSTQVKQPLLVERKGKRIIWRLKAASAKQHENIMLLTAPILELFTENNEIITVHGKQAWFEPIKRNIHFKDKVSVTYRDWILTSNDLRFDSTHDEVIVPNDFIAKGKDTIVKGRGLKAHRKTQIVHIEHDTWLKNSDPDRLRGLQ